MLLKPSHHRTSGMIYRQLVLYRRHLDRQFEIFFWPTVDAILFGAIATFASDSGSSATPALLLSGFVMAQLTWQSHIHLSKFYMQEGWDWNVLYMMSRPVRMREVFAASIGLTVSVVFVAIGFITAAVALTFHLQILEVPPATIILMPLLMVLGWSTALIATSIVLRMGQKADNFVWALFGLIGPLSGAIVPVSSLPGILRYFALLLPTTYVYEAGRAIIFQNEFLIPQLVIGTVLTVITYLLAMWFLSRSFIKFRERGYISRYL